MQTEVEAYVGAGANLGDAEASLRTAFDALGRLPGTRLTAVSPLYRSAPVDATGPDYVNAVVALQTRLGAQALLDGLLEIERLGGRTRSYRNAPRMLDLDLLLYGQLVQDAAGLTLPHPRMHLRAFVLRPLADIAPALAIPGRGPVRELLPQVAGQSLVRI